MFSQMPLPRSGACVYVRHRSYINSQGEDCSENKSKTDKTENSSVIFRTNLVMAKARVAPKNVESVPRLELAACVIGARLSNTARIAYSIKEENIYIGI